MRPGPVQPLRQAGPAADARQAAAGNPLRVLFLVLALALIAVGVAA